MFQTEKTKCFMFNNSFLNHAIYNKEKYCIARWPQMTIWCISIECRMHKATSTHAEYVVLSVQQQLHEHTSMLLYMYTVCLVIKFMYQR